MFTRRSPTDKLDFIARQLAGLMESHSTEESLAKVAEACPPDHAAAVETFRALLEDPGQDSKALDTSSFQTLKALLPAAPGAGGALFREFNDYLQRSQLIFATYWAGIVGLVWYLGILSILALWLGGMFVLFVMPIMEAMFESSGATLPALTQALFSVGMPGLPMFALLLVASVGILTWLAFRFRQRIRKLAPLPRWPSWVPLFGSIARTYNLGLFLNCTRMLRACGVDANEAITAAAGVSNQDDDLSLNGLIQGASDPATGNELSELGIAARLGNFDAELNHQCEQHVGTLTRALVSGRDRLALLLKIVVYAVIAALVIAIYLPIFQMAVII